MTGADRSRVDPPPSSEPLHAPHVLLIAFLIVVVGTAAVDWTRVWLLVIPITLLLAGSSVWAVLNRLTLPRGEDVAGSPPRGDAIGVAVGLALLAQLAVLAALAGQLWIAGMATAAGALHGAVRLGRRGLAPLRGRLAPPAIAAGLLLGVYGLIVWLWAATPPVFYDELEYHLVIPERAIATGALTTLPWVFYTLMPHASDLMLAWGMAIGGELGARAAQFGLWTACLLACWALVGAVVPADRRRGAGVPLVLALAGCPLVWFLGTLTFAETALSLACLAALAVLADPAPFPRPWLPFGLLLGFAASVKLFGVSWVLALLAAAVAMRWPAAAIGRAAAVAAAGAVPWTIRAWVVTGNPVYPLVYHWLGGRYWSERSVLAVQHDLPHGLASMGPVDVLRLPYDLIAAPERFGAASAVGVLAVVSVCAALALPLLAAVRRWPEHERRLSTALAICLAVAGAAWLATSSVTRYFAPGFIAGLVGAVCLLTCLPRIARLAAVAVLAALAALGTNDFLATHQLVFDATRPAVGAEDRERFLSRKLDFADAARFVRTRLPPGARLLFIGDARPYYFKRAAVAPTPHDTHPLAAWVQEAASPEALRDRLRAEGITHVVLNVREFQRLRAEYGLLAFSGAEAEAAEQRLRALPSLLRPLYADRGVYVFGLDR